MELKYSETITRNYSNGVKIQYENIGDDIYIVSITSAFSKQGYGTNALTNFLENFNNKNVYLFATSELGTDVRILNKWYEQLGFVKCSNLQYIPYNITHMKKRKLNFCLQ